MKLIYITCAICAILSAGSISAEDMSQDAQVEQTTESPIADMALVDPKDDRLAPKLPAEAQPHTIADFIIHPLIALKPRQPEQQPPAEGKQASTTSTTPSPWQLFGFNTGQGLGSSVSSLAGQVTGWLGNRIQLPGLVDTPVRESSSSTTSTTAKPDVVVRVQQRQSTRQPLIAINNDNRPFNNRRKNPNRFNNNLDDSEEYNDDDFYDDDDDFDDFDNFNNNNNRHDEDDDDDDDDYNFSNENDDDEDEFDDEEPEPEEDEPVKQQNNNRRRVRPLNNNNNNINNNRQHNNQRRRVNYNNNNNKRDRNQKRRQPQESDEVDQYDDDDDNADDQDFYYNNNQKRSQSQQNLIQRGQQSILNQIRQFTRGQTPAEVGAAIRKSQSASNNNKKRRQQATLVINRNGQTIYVAPELLQAAEVSNNKNKPAAQQYQYYQPLTGSSANENLHPMSVYPQPPLTIPLKRKGKPTQYITIPWSQLGIAPPDQVLDVAEGLQSQPLILNIPQSAVHAMQNPSPSKRKQVIRAEAVPLLADASLMGIFKPPRIPPARTPSNVKPTKKTGSSSLPVVIAGQSKPGSQRIRPGTIVEKAPADVSMGEQAAEAISDNVESSQYIVVGEDGEAGLGRNAYPNYNQFLNYLKNGQLAQRDGRQLNVNTDATEAQQQSEQLIPVKIIADEATSIDGKAEAEVQESLVDPATTIQVNDAKQETPLEGEVKADEIIKPDAVIESSQIE